MEQKNIESLTGSADDGVVIHNIVSAADRNDADPTIKALPGFKVVSVSNYAWLRGNDRLVEIAQALHRKNRGDIRFIVAGNVSIKGSLPGELGVIAARGGSLREYAEARGVGYMFRFLGTVSNPGPIYGTCDIVVRPSRNLDPWGREVIEALSYGLPVISLGQFDKFVENDVTGFLFEEYDADTIADQIITLADSPADMQRLAAASRSRVKDLCNGPERAADLLATWRAILDRK